jgi:hypothetical protein
MHRIVNAAAVAAGILLVPTIAFAQATIAGVVRDASAAVLPGVSVEASSSVLIEKTRTVVTDGTGQTAPRGPPIGTVSISMRRPGWRRASRCRAAPVPGELCATTVRSPKRCPSSSGRPVSIRAT